MKIRLRSEAVTAYCRANGISHAELCRRMRVDPTTLWRIKEGRREPSPKFIAGLVGVTGEPFEALFEIVQAAA